MLLFKVFCNFYTTKPFRYTNLKNRLKDTDLNIDSFSQERMHIFVYNLTRYLLPAASSALISRGQYFFLKLKMK